MDNAETFIQQLKEEAKKLDEEDFRDLGERVALQSQMIVAMAGRIENLEDEVDRLESQMDRVRNNESEGEDDNGGADNSGGYFG